MSKKPSRCRRQRVRLYLDSVNDLPRVSSLLNTATVWFGASNLGQGNVSHENAFIFAAVNVVNVAIFNEMERKIFSDKLHR